MYTGCPIERRGYAFWSLGHCYSPELDYKRALGAEQENPHPFWR